MSGGRGFKLDIGTYYGQNSAGDNESPLLWTFVRFRGGTWSFRFTLTIQFSAPVISDDHRSNDIEQQNCRDVITGHKFWGYGPPMVPTQTAVADRAAGDKVASMCPC